MKYNINQIKKNDDEDLVFTFKEILCRTGLYQSTNFSDRSSIIWIDVEKEIYLYLDLSKNIIQLLDKDAWSKGNYYFKLINKTINLIIQN